MTSWCLASVDELDHRRQVLVGGPHQTRVHLVGREVVGVGHHLLGHLARHGRASAGDPRCARSSIECDQVPELAQALARRLAAPSKSWVACPGSPARGSTGARRPRSPGGARVARTRSTSDSFSSSTATVSSPVADTCAPARSSTVVAPAWTTWSWPGSTNAGIDPLVARAGRPVPSPSPSNVLTRASTSSASGARPACGRPAEVGSPASGLREGPVASSGTPAAPARSAARTRAPGSSWSRQWSAPSRHRPERSSSSRPWELSRRVSLVLPSSTTIRSARHSSPDHLEHQAWREAQDAGQVVQGVCPRPDGLHDRRLQSPRGPHGPEHQTS